MPWSGRARLGACAAALALVPVAARAAPDTPARTVAISDLLALRVAQDPVIARDGTRVVFTLFEPPGPQAEGPTSHVWSVPADGGAPARALCQGAHLDWSPQLSPDGRTLAFLSTRGGAPRLYVMPVEGGEARAVTPPDVDASSPAWSPDGTRLAFLSEELGVGGDYDDYSAAAADERVVSRHAELVRLRVVTVASGELRSVTGDAHSVLAFDWAPSGDAFAVVARARRPGALATGAGQPVELLRVPLAGGHARHLARFDTRVTQPRVAPDGSAVALAAHDGRSAGNVMRTIVLVPADGTGVVRNLLDGYRGSVDTLAWLPDARRIVFNGVEGVHVAPRLLDVATGRVSALVDETFVAEGLSVAAGAPRVAFLAQTPRHPREVWSADLDGRPRRLTRLNPQLDGLRFARREVVHWRADDGVEIEGLLLVPPDLELGRRYPTVVMPHGGSTGWSMWKDGFLTDVGQVMAAAHGYVVFYPNPRGTPGYGRAFEDALVGDVGGRELRDVLDGLDWLVARGTSDAQRLAIGGWSWGGTLAAWAVTQTERFRCAIDGGGVVDWRSFYGQSENPELARAAFDGAPEERAALYAERSALRHVERIRTPLLILHGEDDAHVPVSQAWQMYRALRERGRPVEFVLYPRERHFLLEPAHAANFMTRVLGWYELHLKRPAASAARAAP